MLFTALELDEGGVRVMLLTANEKHARCLEVIQQKREAHVALLATLRAASLLRHGRGPWTEMGKTH